MNEQELKVQGESLAVEAGVLVIVDQPSFERASGMLRVVKDYLKKVEMLCEPVIRAAHSAHKAAVEQKRQLEEPALRAERAIKSVLTAYEQEQSRIRRDAELVAERERHRLEEDARLQAALEAEARGDAAVAENILVAPHPPIPVFSPPAIVLETPKAEGVSFRSQYRAEVTDLPLLIKAVAAGEAPIGALLPNLPMLNQMARAMKSELRIPGVRLIEERIAAVRP